MQNTDKLRPPPSIFRERNAGPFFNSPEKIQQITTMKEVSENAILIIIKFGELPL